MNREIKFRALVQFADLPPDWVYYSTFAIPYAFNPSPKERVKILAKDLQYTGLKDKNGVEIYEGDIVWRYGLLHVVEWNQKVCAFGLVLAAYYGKGDAIGGIAQYTDSPIKVIGNVYENPELLEPKS